MFKDVNDYVNFYYNAGSHAGRYFGSIDNTQRVRIVNQFKNFVEQSGGVERFISSEQAFYRFVQTLKGVKRVQHS